MTESNIYICGVGGQGIGLLSEVLSSACLAAGLRVRGCDTHGLAQRGGTVVSHLRLGLRAHTPRVPPGQADLVVALERLEAMRAAASMLKEGGSVVYYDANYQPWHVRSGEHGYPSEKDVSALVAQRGARLERVHVADLSDPRMQNAALLGRLASREIIAGVGDRHIRAALEATLPAAALEANLRIYEQAK